MRSEKSQHNTTRNVRPIISLSSIDRLDLLRLLFKTVCIPEAVWREVVVHGGNRPGKAEVGNAKWIRRVHVDADNMYRLMLGNLDAGESETIALATEMKADYVILDERAGYVQNVAALLDELEKESFRMSETVREQIVGKAGE